MRTEILLGGCNPGRLFSPRDVTLRGLLSKKKVAESHQLRATIAASIGDADAANKSYGKYIDSTWYSAIKEDRNERMFKEYYTKYKTMRPEILLGPDGTPTVKGLT